MFAALVARHKFFSWFFAPCAMKPGFGPGVSWPAEPCFVEALRVYCMGEEL